MSEPTLIEKLEKTEGPDKMSQVIIKHLEDLNVSEEDAIGGCHYLLSQFSRADYRCGILNAMEHFQEEK